MRQIPRGIAQEEESEAEEIVIEIQIYLMEKGGAIPIDGITTMMVSVATPIERVGEEVI